MDTASVAELFEGIRSALPHLRMELVPVHPKVDFMVTVPPQRGLGFQVTLYLDGDELQITAGQHFWLEWFPSSRPEVVEEYRQAALGLLSGRFRIVEHVRGRRVVKTQLQRPQGSDWKTIGTIGSRLLSMPWGARTTRVLQATRV